MRQNETVPEFKLRYERALRAKKQVNLPDIDEARQAIDFILKVDDHRFGEMKKSLHNASILGHAPYPATLSGAMAVLQNYQGLRSITQQTNSATVFVARANSGGGHKQKSDKKKHGRTPCPILESIKQRANELNRVRDRGHGVYRGQIRLDGLYFPQ
jgi:hypothetical protein